MSISQSRLQDDAIAWMRLHGEREQAAGSEHTRRGGNDRNQIIDVSENVRRQDEMIPCLCVRFGGEELPQL